MSSTFGLMRSGGLLLVAAFTLGSCSGAPEAATSTPTSPPGGGTPQPTSPGGTTQPTQAPGTTATAPPGGGGGTFPDGSWTAGAAHLVVTGDHNVTADLALIPFASMSAEGTTVLQYGSDTVQVFLSISIEPAGVAIVITTEQFIGGSGTTTDTPCAANFARAEANAVEGSVSCASAVVISTGGAINQHINLQASFTATR